MTNSLDNFIPYQMSTATNAVSDLIASEYKSRFGLKIPEWRVMAVLGSGGSKTQRQLVESTLMDKVTVNRAVKVLVDRKLIERSPNNADGRSHHLRLNETGLALYEAIMPAARAMEKKILAVLSAEEQAQFSDMISRVRKSVETIVGK